MSSAILRSFEVAAESSFGSIDSTTGQPSAGTLTFYAAEFERASVTVFGGESELVEDGTAVLGPGGLPPEVSASWTASGTRVRRQAGEVTVQMRVKGWGSGNTGITDANSLPLSLMLSSGMKLTDHGGTALTPSSMGSNNGVVDFGAPPGLADGEVVVANIDGCMVVNRVVKVDGNEATFSHYWPRALTSSDSIQRGLNFAVGRYTDTGAVGSSVAIRGTSLDAQYVAYGCRWSGVSFSNDNGFWLVELTMPAAIIISDIDPAGFTPVTAARIASPTAIARGVALYRTAGGTGVVDAGGASVSLEAAKVPFELDGLTISLENTLTPVGTGCPAIGMSDMEVSGTTASMEYVSRAPTDADELDLLNRVARGITIGGAPVSDGSTALNGFGFNIPAAHLTADPNVTAEDDGLLQQSRAYAMGDYVGDEAGDNTVRNAVIYLGGT